MTPAPLVRLCEVEDCGFNKAKMCHAAAIQVGDEVALAGKQAQAPSVALQDPRCDTYTKRPGAHLGGPDLQALVGNCKMESCQNNAGLQCRAEAIIVGFHDAHADCKTFHPRP